MKAQFLRCEYCKALIPINVEKVQAHFLKEHKLDLSKDFDPAAIVLRAKLSSTKDFEKLQAKELENKQKNEASKKGFEKYETARLNRLRKEQLEYEKERQRDIATHTRTLKIIWHDLLFGKNQIKFDLRRLNTIVSPVACHGVFESLNLIENEYFLRLYSKKIYKLTFYKGELIVERSPDWKQILDTIEFAKEFYEFKHLDLKSSGKTKRFIHLSNEEIVSLFEKSFCKSDYLKFLASKQSENHKIIPVMEFINNHTEESFLFRVTVRSGTALTLWENVNEARATHIFTSPKDSTKCTLDLVEEFICRQDIDAKRSMLYHTHVASRKLKEKLLYVKCIKHTGLDDYRREIDYLVEYY